MLFEGFQVTKAAVFINESVLVVISAVLFGIFDRSSNQAGLGNIFHIDLYFLTRIICGFILLWLVFGIRKLYRHLPSFPQKSIQAGDGSAVASLPQFHPEHYQSCIRITSAHIVYELDLIDAMLVRMTVRPM